MIVLFYLFALINLLLGTAAIYMALIPVFPVSLLYYHYFLRKPLVWTIFAASFVWSIIIARQTGSFPTELYPPLLLMGLGVFLSYRLHQETAFRAVDYPPMAVDIASLPMDDDMQLAVIEYGGVSKAYPLDYVIHHHIINDRFGDRIVALSYCAMCRSIIPFDVTDIGPLFVASFKNANMIVADRKTRTFFQQASFESIIGKLHPHTLSMIPYQILPWSELKRLTPLPQVVSVSERDLRAFELPIPGVWKRIISSDVTPGLPASQRDKRFPPRTRVVGIIDPIARPSLVFIKNELLQQGLVVNRDLDITLVAFDNTVLAFKNRLQDKSVELSLGPDKSLIDSVTNTVWDIRGKYKSGELKTSLQAVALSDEYWFSWKHFHPDSKLIRYAQ